MCNGARREALAAAGDPQQEKSARRLDPELAGARAPGRGALVEPAAEVAEAAQLGVATGRVQLEKAVGSQAFLA